ncbi:MAG: dTDP-glucose 4,6-dehydratase [Candidatus Adiutrix sp.]|jgi:dTDP-glucose 4,6-dehydratase|nr:dTDP-glucose 4,6-dehydratase [Candidatus Adiutrix sp.]
MAILVTGGAGFIGTNFILDWTATEAEPVVNLDLLTYAGHPGNFERLAHPERHLLVRGDLGDRELAADLLARHRVRAVLNFAAESHVDRSILGPAEFIRTNIVGVFNLLEAVREYWAGLPDAPRAAFRFLQVSTDEVFGALTPEAPAFTETTPYAPNSPYSASKAAADHLVRAYRHTYDLPTLTTNCSNNYGPFQFPEKLVPLLIVNALEGRPLPVYGDGLQRRDWLHVSDHVAALRLVLAAGRPGETYNIGGGQEKANLEVVEGLCDLLDRRRPRPDGRSYRSQVTHVADRPGHDRRYAVNADKIQAELGWRPKHDFQSGLAATVEWYLAETGWLENVRSGGYRDWISKQYGVAYD